MKHRPSAIASMTRMRHTLSLHSFSVMKLCHQKLWAMLWSLEEKSLLDFGKNFQLNSKLKQIKAEKSTLSWINRKTGRLVLYQWETSGSVREADFNYDGQVFCKQRARFQLICRLFLSHQPSFLANFQLSAEVLWFLVAGCSMAVGLILLVNSLWIVYPCSDLCDLWIIRSCIYYEWDFDRS